MLVKTESYTFYYLDQQMHNIYINNGFLYLSTPTRFDAFASSSGSLIFYFLKLQNVVTRLPEDEANASKHVGVLTI